MAYHRGRKKEVRAMVHPASAQFGGSSAGILRSIVLNAAIPALLYSLTKRYVSDSDVVALSIAAIFPLVGSIGGLVRHRRMSIIAVLAVLGIAVSVGALALGGDPKILLIRESFLTGALGIACFVSLVLPRPLMFYFGREMEAGSDPAKIAAFDAESEHPAARRVHRLITTVWGIAFVGEFVLRVILVLSLPAVVVLAITPFILGGVTIATLAWTFAYVRTVRKRAAAQ
jgi:hypothetical protein